MFEIFLFCQICCLIMFVDVLISKCQWYVKCAVKIICLTYCAQNSEIIIFWNIVLITSLRLVIQEKKLLNTRFVSLWPQLFFKITKQKQKKYIVIFICKISQMQSLWSVNDYILYKYFKLNMFLTWPHLKRCYLQDAGIKDHSFSKCIVYVAD